MSRAPRETQPLLSPQDTRSSSVSLAPPNELSKRKFWTLMGTLWFGTFLAAVDGTIVSTLLATIASELKTLDSISWVATAYLVAYSALQPLYGKLSDIYGRKRVLLTSTFFFGLGCQVCAMASGMSALVVGRLLNGIGAGGMLSMGSITVSDYVSPRDRGVYQGIGNMVFGVGAAMGGVIGSAAQAYAGWRFAFSIQVPLSILSICIITVNMVDKAPKDEILPQDTAQAGHPVRKSSFERIDFVGSVSLASFVSLLMLAVTTGGNQFEWFSWPIAAFVVGALALFVLFVYWETHVALEPVLPIWLMTDRTVLSTCFLNFFSSGIAYSYIYYVPIYLAAYLEYTPAQVSRILIGQFVGGPMGSLGAGLLIRKSGKYWKLGVKSSIGLTVSSIMWLGLALFPGTLVDTWPWQMVAYFIGGISYVSILTISLVTLIAAAPDHQATATSAQYTFRGSGSSMVLASAAAIFNNVLHGQLNKNVVGKHAHSIINKVVKSVSAIRDAPVEFQPAIIAAYRSAITSVFIMSFALSLLCILCTVIVREVNLDHKGTDRN